MLAVLGRGQSLIEFKNYSSQFTRIFIVNKFDDKIKNIGTHHFQNKDLVHVQGIGFDHNLAQEYQNLFHSIRIVKNDHTLPQIMMQRGYPVTTPWSKLINNDPANHRKLISQLEQEERENVVQWKKYRPNSSGRWWPTTGIFAIEYALLIEKPDQLWLFGFDFYEPYHDHPTNPTKNIAPKISSMMKYHLLALIQEFQHTQFYIFTKSESFRPQFNNCHLHVVA